jgi:hypothetical protein
MRVPAERGEGDEEAARCGDRLVGARVGAMEGRDLRRCPIEQRKATLRRMIKMFVASGSSTSITSSTAASSCSIRCAR